MLIFSDITRITFITFKRSYQCEADAGVAAGRFNNRRARFQQSLAFRVFDHRQRDAVLYTAAGIGRFQLGVNIRSVGRDHTVQLDQRSTADKFQTVF